MKMEENLFEQNDKGRQILPAFLVIFWNQLMKS